MAGLSLTTYQQEICNMKILKVIVMSIVLGAAGLAYASSEDNSSKPVKMTCSASMSDGCCKEGSQCKADAGCCVEGSACCAADCCKAGDSCCTSDCCKAGASCCASDGSGCKADGQCCSNQSCCSAKAKTAKSAKQPKV